jgi:hypothetical protein
VAVGRMIFCGMTIILVPRRKLWVSQSNIESHKRRRCAATTSRGVLVDGASPDGTANFDSAMRIAVKPCACGAPLRGCGA